MSSYEITFGRKPFNIPQYIVRTSDVAAIDDMLTSREVVFTEVRKKLLKAQAIMKHNADKKRRDVHFKEGDWVMVKLCPHRQASVPNNSHVFQN